MEGRNERMNERTKEGRKESLMVYLTLRLTKKLSHVSVFNFFETFTVVVLRLAVNIAGICLIPVQ
jgi:hypothetical protein